jgi:hypothetical protein
MLHTSFGGISGINMFAGIDSAHVLDYMDNY